MFFPFPAKGVNVLFSGVIPRNVIPERHKIFRAALALGAKVHKHLVTSGDDKTTHVVAARLGTEKVLHAQRLDLYISGMVHNVRRGRFQQEAHTSNFQDQRKANRAISLHEGLAIGTIAI